MIEMIAAATLSLGVILGIGVGAALHTSEAESKRERRELNMISHEEARKRYKTTDIDHKR